MNSKQRIPAKASSTGRMSFETTDSKDLFSSFGRTSTGLSRMHQSTSNGSVGGKRLGDISYNVDFEPISPTDQQKYRRQQEREKAKAEHKALLLEQQKEEEIRKSVRAAERHDQIAKNYSTFTTGTPMNTSKTRSGVMQQIAKFDAAAELNEEKKSQEMITTPTRSRYPLGMVSPQHSYSGRPRNKSTESIDPKVTDDQVTAL